LGRGNRRQAAVADDGGHHRHAGRVLFHQFHRAAQLVVGQRGALTGAAAGADAVHARLREQFDLPDQKRLVHLVILGKRRDQRRDDAAERTLRHNESLLN
jgi:hypothetical protein